MTLKTPRARAFPLVLVALTATAACSGGSSEEPGGSAGGSSGASNAGSGGKAGASSGGSAGSGGSSQAGTGGNGSGGKAGASSGGSAGSGGSSQAGSGGSGGTGGSSGGELCANRTGGALIEFGVVKETITVWIEDEAFITEAQRLLAADETRVPVFNTLIDGTDCDTQYTWHPDPNDVEFADFTIEVCDAVPSYIEENKQDWFNAPGQWCPWSAVVIAVTER